MLKTSKSVSISTQICFHFKNKKTTIEKKTRDSLVPSLEKIPGFFIPSIQRLTRGKISLYTVITNIWLPVHSIREYTTEFSRWIVFSYFCVQLMFTFITFVRPNLVPFNLIQYSLFLVHRVVTRSHENSIETFLWKQKFLTTI